jgi:hypothetical protein
MAIKLSSQGSGELETVGITSQERRVCDVLDVLGEAPQGLVP